MTKPHLAIMLPTFRFDPPARQALITAAATGSTSISVHIGDNSANPEKHAFLKDLAAKSTNVFVHCHERDIGAYANWMFLLKSQDAPFVCLAADDDGYLPAYFQAGLDLIANDAGCSAASGLFISTAHQASLDRPVLDSQPPRLELDPLERIKNYIGQNAIAYAINRREVINGFADYVAQNPLNGPFNDYLLTFHLLSMGTYKVCRNALAYVYDNSLWQFPHAEWASSGKFYVSAGLPIEFQHFFKLHWAVSNVHFFESQFRSSTLATEDASAIAAHLFDRLRSEAKWDCSLSAAEIDALFASRPAAREAFSALLETPFSNKLAIFDLFTRLVADFSPKIADDLQRFYQSTLLPEPQRPRPDPPPETELKEKKQEQEPEQTLQSVQKSEMEEGPSQRNKINLGWLSYLLKRKL